ncbi:MAG: hypothetical protein LBQ74_13825 [Prevotella sp.]|jgi:hypothetical protein|nr:hypothetical protein [Prevotella sp.]
MDKGYIKLSRKSFAHKFWTKARVFSEFEAWVDLIQSALFMNGETGVAIKSEYIDGREIKYGRGQYPASIRFLAKKWSWGDQKVRSFLNELKRDGSIKTDSSQGVNIITICKYDKYNSVLFSDNTANNTANNTDILLILKELQQLKTQVITHQITQSQHSGNTNNKKDNIFLTLSLTRTREERIIFKSLAPLMEELLNDQACIEDFRRTGGPPYPDIPDITDRVKEFFAKLTVDGETAKERKDAVYHFKSWYRQQLEAERTQNQKGGKNGTAARAAHNAANDKPAKETPRDYSKRF